MFNINFYTFTKAKNSTKRPEGDGVAYQCELIQGTSTYSPTIQLNIGVANVSRTNYCYIPELGRYYFVSNWSWEDGLWSADLETDVLATWKIDIGNLTAYILRSASEYDGRIIDNMYPCKAQPDYSQVDIDLGYAHTLGNGTFIVGIVTGGTYQSVGTTTYYAMSYQQILAFMGAIINTDLWDEITDISSALFRSLFNPFQYIVSCLWVPLSLDALTNKGCLSSSTYAVHFGWWTLSGQNAKVVLNPYCLMQYSASIPKHPQVARGVYLNGSPFSDYSIVSTLFGCFSLPDLSRYDTLSFDIENDLIAGKAILNIRAGETGVGSEALLKMESVFGLQIPLAQSANDIVSGASGVIGGSVQAIAGAGSGNIAVGITGVLSAVGSALGTLKPRISSTPASGSMVATVSDLLSIVARFYEVADEDRTDKGRPLCKVRKINTLSGYIQCSESEYNLPCYGAEYDAISAYLSGGFFYE